MIANTLTISCCPYFFSRCASFNLNNGINLLFIRYRCRRIDSNANVCTRPGPEEGHKQNVYQNNGGNMGNYPTRFDVNKLCGEGCLKEGLRTNTHGVWMDSSTYFRILQTCGKMGALEEGKRVHAHIIKYGFEEEIFIRNNLVNMYSKCARIVDARQVFDKMPMRDVVSWTTLIGGYAQNGYGEEALELYNQMQQAGVMPNQFTFAAILKACAAVGVLGQGRGVHAQISKIGVELNVVLSSALIEIYGKCGSIADARQVFDKMPKRDVIAWTAMIVSYSQLVESEEALKLFGQMQEAGVKPNQFTLATVLKVCAGVDDGEYGKRVHAHIVKSGIESNVVVRSALVYMYANCSKISDASNVFERMAVRDVVLWTAMIAGYARNGHGEQALKLFWQMQLAGMKPNEFTLASVLKASSIVAALKQGQQIHAHIIETGLEVDVSIGNALLDLYAKCGRIADSIRLFNKMSRPDVISWTLIIAAYVQAGYCKEALRCFNQMQQANVKPNSFTFSYVLRAFADLEAMEQGKQIHAHLIRTGLDQCIALENALVDMYAKCGNLEDARRLFEKMPERDAVSWTVMISGNAQNGHCEESLKLFSEMQRMGMMPDKFSFASILSVCARLASLQLSRQFHSHIIKTGFVLDVSVGNTLVDVYAKCGSLEDGCRVFDRMADQNVVSWNAMIAGFAHHGLGDKALQLFQQMQHTGIEPDHITFIVVLYACSHVGLVDKGWDYFNSMSLHHGITPTLDHFVCMVDLLGRAGHLDEAADLINTMPFEPDALVYKTLLAACKLHGDTELGKYAAESVLMLESKDAATYVLLSNIYADAGKWDCVATVRKLMKDRGVKKMPGYSWIEIRNRVHGFVVGDRSHPQTDEIYAKLESLLMQMKEVGYVPDTNFAPHDLDQEQKEFIVCHHSEKLAIAFGLINTPLGTPILVFKNLRVCGDCHTATKFISKIAMREIVVRDANRFHQFKGGLCSCTDYW